MSERVTTCQAALWFASAGYPVLPLHSATDDGGCTCGDRSCPSPAKHPIAHLAPRGLKDAVTDLDTIRDWFTRCYWANFGICTDTLLVVDVDVKSGGVDRWKEICSQSTHGLVGSSDRSDWRRRPAPLF